MNVTVRDLRHMNREIHYSGEGMTPTLAVICAYAQDLGDWNTWEYGEKYADKAVVGKHTVFCGDFSAFLDQRMYDICYPDGSKTGPFAGLPLAVGSAKSLLRGLASGYRHRWLYIEDRSSGERVAVVTDRGVEYHGKAAQERKPKPQAA